MDEKKFKNVIWNYYKKNGREFPWRSTTEAYRIIVSEVMLQQTQTSRVLIKYDEFLKAFPTSSHLRDASLSKVLKVWSGLGYNRRALYLQQTIKKLIEEYNGQLPDAPHILEGFPGIGKATARSILVFSKNVPLAFIETNIRRVFIHFFFPNVDNVNDKDILPLVEKTMDLKNPREWFYALMDYGVDLAKTEKENSNKKSKHYTRQSNFEGSIRKVRGEILRQLIDKHSIPIQDLSQIEDSGKVTKAIEGLLKDKLIIKKGNIISLLEQQ